MKKNILPTLLLAGFATTALAQIPNNSFENWTSMGTYDLPDNWATLNNKTAVQALFTATKATPGNPGNSYLKLTSKTINGSVVPGVAVCGKMDTVTMLPKSGFPFSQRPASLGGKWQHMIYGSSQGSIMVLLTRWNATTSTRDTVAHGLQGLSGMAMSWAGFSFNLTYMDSLHNPDSCTIVLRASGSAPTNNDYLWVDGLAFTGTVALASPPNLVGLNENLAPLSHVSVFPNPANEQVGVSFELTQSQLITIRVSDLNVKLIREKIFSDTQSGLNSVTFDTRKLSRGVYVLTITGDRLKHTSKFVIE